MVDVAYSLSFQKTFERIKDQELRKRIYRHIDKVLENPEIGKPMQHERKGTREVYIWPYRLSYVYLPQEDKVVILAFYHKDQQ